MKKLLANENFPLTSILYLRQKGYDVSSIGTDIPGIKDSLVLAIANEQERIILTFDRDNGELIFKHNFRPLMGVIYLRFDEYTPEETGIFVENLLSIAEIDFSNALTVLDKRGVRQRKY